jgi:hypothetical protein
VDLEVVSGKEENKKDANKLKKGKKKSIQILQTSSYKLKWKTEKKA